MEGGHSARVGLAAEFFVIFIFLPLAFYFHFIPLPPIPALWLVAIYCFARLMQDASFDRRKLWNPASFYPRAWQIFLLFLISAVGVGLCVAYFAPQLLFNFIKRSPIFWTLLMVLYPIFSVYPQGLIYRAFFFERYQRLFPTDFWRIAVSALAFSFVHIVFRNPIAVSLTLIGGVIFAWRYAATNSLFTSAFEHALYGCWMFTIGLGDFFYKGAR